MSSLANQPSAFGGSLDPAHPPFQTAREPGSPPAQRDTELYTTCVDRSSGRFTLTVANGAESGSDVIRIGLAPPWQDDAAWSGILYGLMRQAAGKKECGASMQ